MLKAEEAVVSSRRVTRWLNRFTATFTAMAITSTPRVSRVAKLPYRNFLLFFIGCISYQLQRRLSIIRMVKNMNRPVRVSINSTDGRSMRPMVKLA